MPFYQSITFNRQKPIGPFIVDFYCHRLSLVVEIDGDSHGEEANVSYDKRRTRYLESQGLKVIRFTNWEVRNNIAGVMEALEDIVKKEESP